MEEMIVSLLPIFLLIGLGGIIRKIDLLSAEAINGLKTIIIKIALPGVLFLAFAKAEPNLDNLTVVILVFAYCVALYLIGGLLHRFLPKWFPDSYTNGYFTGFEFGMIGIGLFTAIWGMEQLPIIAVIAFGHEVFIWFVYVPILERRKHGKSSFLATLKNFIKTPTIMGILLGILFSAFNLYDYFSEFIVGKAVLGSLNLLGNTIAPLILIVIGYSITFKRLPVRKTIRLLLTRWVVVLGLGYGVILLIGLINADISDFFIKAFFAFILLPPPYILPLFIKEDCEEEIGYFSELLIYYTILSFVGYIILMSV